MPIIASFDPGHSTGCTIVDHDGKLITASTVRDNGSVLEYMAKLIGIKNLHHVDLALIESAFTPPAGYRRFNSEKVRIQIRMIQDVFPIHVMTAHSQWNGARYKATMKRQLFAQFYGEVALSEHAIDSALMVNIVLNKSRQRGGYEYLLRLAQTTKKFPTAKEMAT